MTMTMVVGFSVRDHCDKNLMTARNLGVVFGRECHFVMKKIEGLMTGFVSPSSFPWIATLMWSRDPGSEFSDMAGKALMVEWLIENAPHVFPT